MDKRQSYQNCNAGLWVTKINKIKDVYVYEKRLNRIEN